MDIGQIIEAWRPLDGAVSQAVLDGYELSAILPSDAHFHLHPQSFDQFETLLTRWSKAGDYQQLIDRVLSVLTVRRDLHREFAQ
jgi:hypothetical protein